MSDAKKVSPEPFSPSDGKAVSSSSPEATAELIDDGSRSSFSKNAAHHYNPAHTVVMHAGVAAPAPPLQSIQVSTTPQAYLLVCMGSNVGHRYPLGAFKLSLGRADNADVKIDDDRVSSKHCEIHNRGGRHRIFDLGSANGVLVNAQRVEDIDLRDGDLIQVGYTVFKYLTLEPGVGLGSTTANTAPPAPAYSAVPQYPAPYQAPPGYPPFPPQYPAPYQYDPQISPYSPPPYAQSYGYPNTRRDDDEVDLAKIIAQFRRIIGVFLPYSKFISVLTIVGIVLGGLTYFISPPKAAAIFEIMLQNQGESNPLKRFENSTVEFFKSASTNFLSPKLIEKTLTELNIKPEPGLVSVVQNNLKFTSVGGMQSNTYEGRYSADSTENGLKFIEKHLTLFLETEIDKTMNTLTSKIEVLQEKLKDRETELKSTEEKVLAFKKQNMDGQPDQAKQYYDLYFDLQRRENEIQTMIDRSGAQAGVEYSRLKDEKPMVESRVMATRPYQAAIIDVNRQLAETKAKGLGDEHPDVRGLKTKLEQLKSLATKAENSNDDTEIERARNPLYDSAQDNLRRFQADRAAAVRELARIRQEINKIQLVVKKLPQLEAEYAELTRSYDNVKEDRNRIFDELKQLQLQFDLEKKSVQNRFQIITPPRSEPLNLPKFFMKRMFIFAMLGFITGIVYAAYRFIRRTYWV